MLSAVLLFVMSLFNTQTPAPALKVYQLVLLRTGPNYGSERDPGRAAAVQAAHQAYLETLSRRRVNLVYGPFLDSGDPRGLLVFDVANAAEARALMAADPHVKAGNLVIDIKSWRAAGGVFGLPAHYDVAKPGALDRLIVGVLKRPGSRPRPAPEVRARDHDACLAAIERRGAVALSGIFPDDEDWYSLVIYRASATAGAPQPSIIRPALESGALLEERPWATLAGVLRQ
jgi:uncharacterized protein YciI